MHNHGINSKIWIIDNNHQVIQVVHYSMHTKKDVYLSVRGVVVSADLGGISSSVLSVIFTDKFALSQSDARISVAYNSCQ